MNGRRPECKTLRPSDFLFWGFSGVGGELFATAQRFVMSRFACSRRLASLRFGTGMAGCARLMPIPHFGPSSLLTTAQRFVDVTLRLLTTLGFLATRDNHGRLRLPGMVIPRSSPSELFATAQRFVGNFSKSS